MLRGLQSSATDCNVPSGLGWSRTCCNSGSRALFPHCSVRHLRLYRQSTTNTASSTVRVPAFHSAAMRGGYFPISRPCGIDLRRLSFRNAQRLPLFAAQMLAEIENLPHVVRRMQHAAISGLHHRMRFSPDVHRTCDVLRLQAPDRVEHRLPTSLPAAHELFARVGGD